jgi:hypothetical protein
MLIRYEDLTSLSMTALDGSAHPVRDLLIDDRNLALAYVVIDVGGWFDGREAVVGIEQFGTPDVSASSWPSDLDSAALEDRMNPSASGDDGRLRPKAHQEGRGAADVAVRSVGDWIEGTDIAASDGSAGRLMGLIFDTDTWAARHLVVETGGRLPQAQRVVPSESIAEIDWGGRTIKLDTTVERVHSSPQLHEKEGLTGKWYNSVLAYYGLQS